MENVLENMVISTPERDGFHPESNTGWNITDTLTVSRDGVLVTPDGVLVPDTPVCVVLDNLAFMVDCGIAEPFKDQKPIMMTESIVLEYLNRGTPVFNHSWHVYLWGEYVANIHTHSKNEQIIKAGVAKLEIANHVLYSSSVMEVLKEVMEGCKMPALRGISSLHIALDGANYVHKFLNDFVKQSRQVSDRWDNAQSIRLKGNANLDCKRFNKVTGLYDNFKFGSVRKSFVLYDKTSELMQSHKTYIKDAWDRCQMDTAQVWRCELRMSSQTVKEIKDFDLSRIQDPNYLLSIMKTQLKNFADFVYIDGNDSNITRGGKEIDLFQFKRLKIPLLGRITRKIVRGAYKAKMAIHNAYMNINLNIIKGVDKVGAAVQHINDCIEVYNLQDWYASHVPRWREMYVPLRI